jgi:hypothetical protein
MAWAVVKNGIVVDRLRVEPISVVVRDYAAQFIEAPDDVDHGWTFDGTNWIAPPPPPPAPEPPKPTKEQLLAQLQALQAQIMALE